tara:strand:+ start:776 stop:925 length:150 start_codon:yes stop_codon:yes gene_type:complete
MAKKTRKDIEVCSCCGNYINDKSRVKYILSDAEDALKRYNKKFMKRRRK